jgi:AraC family transcriptional regulator, regulatory protein of adaptative response / DNA-3-methyladenine glycosylase II
MRLSSAQMYARMLASDASCDGRFFTGVLTTGVYCLPSCKARKPRPENVRFFPTCESARSAGLRACKKCHPDDFARGAEPVLIDLETLVAEMRERPQSFPDVRAVVRRSGFGPTRLFEIFRLHYHTTPADLLLRAKLERSKHLLQQDAASSRGDEPGSVDSVTAHGYTAGFESASTFHERFREFHGLTPGSYRALAGATSFTLILPDQYPLPHLRRALSRDPDSLTERWQGDRYSCAVRTNTAAAILEIEFLPAHLHVSLHPAVPRRGAALPLLPAFETHAVAVRLLGLGQDAAGLVRLTQKLGLSRLTKGRPGLRLTGTLSTFDGLLWAIIGQQVNYRFACRLKRRLVERTGLALADGLYLPPSPDDVAALDPAELEPLQFSRRKAEYLITAARQVASGQLPLAEMAAWSATRAERTLLGLRGLGPWSANYLLMRALCFADCVPLGDTGVTSALQALLALDQRPDAAATRRLMAVFSPYRSLATAHLWQYLQPPPS